MHHPLRSLVREWWWCALSFLLVFLAANAVVSFLYAKLYPSHCTRPSHVPLHVQQQTLELLQAPRQLYLHVDTPLLPLADKDLVVRSAYVNPFHDKRHKNSTVILIEVRRNLVEQEAFEGCGVGPFASTEFEIVSINSDSCFHRSSPHTQALVYCHNLPVRHLDRAWVGYTKSILGEPASFIARAEQPLLLHKSGNTPLGNIVVCGAMLPHYTPFLEDWLRYLRRIGVDHVHLTLESVFLNRGRFDDHYLQALVEESFLSVEFWHRWLNSTDICDHSLDLALYNCVLQFRGTHSHIVLGDPRDFFIPRDPSIAPSLPAYISHWCPVTHCQFEWNNLFYRQCEMARDDGNVTAVVSAKDLVKRSEFFTVYKSVLLSGSGSDAGLPRLAQGSATVVPAGKGYFAHLVRHANASNVRILPEHEQCSR